MKFIFILWVSWGLAGVALAYEPMRTAQGVEVRWPEGHMAWRLCVGLEGDSGGAALAGLEGALVWWSEGGLRGALAVEGGPCALDGLDGRVGLMRISEGWPSAFGDSSRTVGFTVHTYRVEVLEGVEVAVLVDADVALNDETFDFYKDGSEPGSFDIGAVVGHEMGHVLGLGHPCGDGMGAYPSCERVPEAELLIFSQALMFPGQSVGDRAGGLGADDLASLGAVWGDLVRPWEVLEQGVCVGSSGAVEVLFGEAEVVVGRGGTGRLEVLEQPWGVLWRVDGGARWIDGSAVAPCEATAEADKADTTEPKDHADSKTSDAIEGSDPGPPDVEASGDCGCRMRVQARGGSRGEWWCVGVGLGVGLWMARRQRERQ